MPRNIAHEDLPEAGTCTSTPIVESTEPCSIGFCDKTPSSASTNVPCAPLKPFFPVAQRCAPNPCEPKQPRMA